MPLLHQTDKHGGDFYDLLDRDGAARLVSGVDTACNNSDLVMSGGAPFAPTAASPPKSAADRYTRSPVAGRHWRWRQPYQRKRCL